MIIEPKTYYHNNAVEFMFEHTTKTELFRLFQYDLPEQTKFKQLEFKEYCEEIFEGLNCLGWTDYQIIEHILKQRKNKYIMLYIDQLEQQDDYFIIIKMTGRGV